VKPTRQILFITLFYSLALILTGLLAGSPSAGAAGLYAIVRAPAQLTIDYFKLGTVGGTFLNAGLVGLACTLLLWRSRAVLSGTSLMAYFLTVGFSFFGINVVNIWPCFWGTWLFTRVTRQPFSAQVNIALFSTSLSPFVSEALCRYPVFDALPAALLWRIGLALALGVVIGFLLPILCGHGPNLHRGYSLYNAASVAGFLGVVLFSVIYRAAGCEIPTNTDIGDSFPVIVNVFALTTSALMLLAGFLLNGRSFHGYSALLRSTGYRCDFTQSCGIPLTLINLGLFGLFTVGYYNLISASFTGPTAGAVVCLLAIAPCGTHILTMLPIILGYAVAAAFCAFSLDTQAIVVGLCFAGALSPITGRFGSLCGVAAGILHACLVTTVVTFHGGFCLYNGGFTAGITAIVLAPVLEYFFTPRDRLALLPQRKPRSDTPS